jgi:DNA-binding NarL/FixJ family response regulator
VLAEDSLLLREGLVRLLAEAGHDVVASVGAAPELAEAVARFEPDIAIVDVRMPPTFTDDGLRAAVAARAAHPGLAVLVLSQYVEESYARELLADGQGGTGYLLKDRIEDLDALNEALERIAGGACVIDPQVVAQLMVRRQSGSGLDRLTRRELEVLGLMAQGRSNAAIAAELVLTAGAVEKHISNVFAKLDLPPSLSDHRRVLAVLAYLHRH